MIYTGLVSRLLIPDIMKGEVRVSDCIFCKIINKEIPSTVVYEDDKVLAFKDINPEASVHVLVVPKQHIKNIEDINKDNADVLKDIHFAIQKVAEKTGVSTTGYRVITNCGADGGQTVFHLHYHVLGGEKLKTTVL